MDLVDRKAVLEAIRLGMTVTQIEREIMSIPVYDGVQEDRLKAVPDFSEDRSAIQGTNPGLAELIKERQEAIAKEATRQETLTREEKAKIVGAWHDYHGA